jgi:endogenous inhibitor of DNA gyrase (YacG/DUF329 family)
MKARCPTCGKPVDPRQKTPWRPFCCERCRLIDLGAWLDESHSIPSAEEGGMGEISGDSQLENRRTIATGSSTSQTPLNIATP